MIVFVVTVAILSAFVAGLFVGALFAYVKEEETSYEAAQKRWRHLEGL